MRVFLSLGMVGKSDEKIKDEINVMTTLLPYLLKINNVDYDNIEVVDSFVEEKPGKDIVNVGVWYSGMSILALSTADCIVFADNYNEYGGCLLEEEIAKYYKVPRYYMHQLIK